MRPLRPEESQWLFSPPALHQTPSSSDDIPLEDELQRRKRAIGYMRSLAVRAAVIANPALANAEHSQLRGVMTVASVLTHRFYMRKSLQDFSERLIAPTVLFLASKIEEEPLKLRHIVNAWLAKFEPDYQARGMQWFPTEGGNEQPSREYRNCERDVLIAEEILLETLCFDMGVEQPWVILRRCVKGLDEVLTVASDANSNGNADGTGNEHHGGDSGGPRKRKITESIVVELGWTLISEILITPICILHPAPIIAYTTFALVLAMVERIPLDQALSHAAEVGDSFHLDIIYVETGPEGGDVKDVRACLDQVIEYIKSGLIDSSLLKYIVQPKNEDATPYPRRFGPLKLANGSGASHGSHAPTPTPTDVPAGLEGGTDGSRSNINVKVDQ